MPTSLITGGAGFIGSHLAEALVNDGNRVIVVDDESTGSMQNLQPLSDHPQFEFIHGTVSDRDLVSNLVDQADEVYHLAAAVGVALINQEPIQTIERNIYPTELLLAEVQRRNTEGHPVRLFLASTSEVYGKNPKAKWTEEDDLVFGATTRPRWSYGASKAIDEFLSLAYWHQKKTPVVIGRFFNVVGPRQTGAYGMVLPRFVDACLAGKSPMVHHDGSQIRCFAHVADVVGAVIKLMRSDRSLGEVFNIGSDRPVTILELAQMVIQQVNPELEVQFQTYEEAYSANFEDILRRVPDLTKIKGCIDYTPQFTLEDIVADVVRFKTPQ
ncbi:SDR family NAD(P)-dependent oxidoreductase [bacterium]|nr:SDR family NAD(P)-dependent oxidoreductase [bacterium]